MANAPELFERLPEPALLLSARGETLHGNRAFLALAERLAVPPLLASLFGPPSRVLLAEAQRTGGATGFLPLVTGENLSHGYRVQITPAGDGDTWIALLVDLSEEAEWRHQLFRRNTELAVLNDIGAALGGALEPGELAERIWQQTGRIMRNDDFFIAARDPESGGVTFLTWVQNGRPDHDMVRCTRDCAVTEHVLSTGKPLLLNGDVTGQLVAIGIEPAIRDWASLLVVPVVVDGRPLGVIALHDRERSDRYGAQELGVMGVIATQAAAALRTSNMFETMRRAHDELSRTQAQLLESERLRGVTETVGALNHEVNNPLATIAGTAQLLLRSPIANDEGLRDRLERILSAAKRIQQVTARMSSVIQAHSRPYPGNSQILDLRRSITREDRTGDGMDAAA